jgi:hypothetical protein
VRQVEKREGTTMAKEKLSFYDVKSKKKFETDQFKVQERSGRFFAVAKAPGATHDAWRVLSAEQAKKFK